MDEEEPALEEPLTPAPLEQPPVVVGEEAVPESELPAPVLEPPQLVGAGAVHRAQAGVRQGLFLN